MKIRTRIILCFTLLIIASTYFLTNWIVDDLRPRYLESVEEVLIDLSQVLATLLENEIEDQEIDPTLFAKVFSKIRERSVSARVYLLIKTQVDLRVYITNDQGKVLFDSAGLDEGKNYSQWRDVFLTLRGEYGSRTSFEPRFHKEGKVLYVSAPIKLREKIVGVVTVGKPTSSVNHFIQLARPKIIFTTIVAALFFLAMAVAISLWVTIPINRLTAYAKTIRDGKRAPFPLLGRSEIGAMGEAFEQMRQALEGKKYVEHYVQAFTHELKSPLSAIRGAAELLEEDPPIEKRRQFLENIQSETERIQQLVDRLLQLALLENRLTLDSIESIALSPLLSKILLKFDALLLRHSIRFSLSIPEEITIFGERLLLEQIFSNLLQNALEFAKAESAISISACREDSRVAIRIENEGASIPDYALPKLFDRFFSLPRPNTGKKSTGLGLSFVKEAVELHGGEVKIENRKEGGVRVILLLKG